MDGLSDRVEYISSISDEEIQENNELNMNGESNEDSEGFYFESDQLAIKDNEDYHKLLKTIVVLEAQREHAILAIEKVLELKKEAEENPFEIIERLKSGIPLGIPDRQTLPEIPTIDWSRYNLPPPPEPCRTQDRSKSVNDSENSAVEMETCYDNTEKRSKVLVRGREFDDSKPETFNQLWTTEEQRRLEELLTEYPPEEVETRRWKKIADALGNRTVKQVQSRVQKYFIKLQKAGLPIPGRCPRPQNECQQRKPYHKHQRNNHLLFKPSTFFPCYDVPMSMSDSEDESYLPKRVFSTKEDWQRDKSDNEEDEEEMAPIPVEAKITIGYRKLEIFKQVKKEMEWANGTSKSEHVGYQCDVCKEVPIQGSRWHCDECQAAGESVDYCSDCVITLLQELENPFSSANPKLLCTRNPHPLKHLLRPIRGRSGKTKTSDWDPDSLPESSCVGYNYLDPNFMPE